MRRVGRIAEQRSHDAATVAVLAGDGQADAPVRGLAAPVDLVEPVAGIVAVLVHVLGAQQVVAGLEERDSLPQRHQAHGHHLSARTRGDAVSEAGLQLHRVEEVLVVVDRAVVHRLDRTLGVSGWLAVVVHLRSGDGGAGAVDKGVVAQIAGEADVDPVGVLKQLDLLLTREIGCHW